MNKPAAWLAIGLVVGPIAFAPFPTLAQGATSLPAREHPLKPEKNPPGDIPDNQVFVDYQSPLGFSIKVPEGWARRQTSDGVTFSDKYNTIEIIVAQRAEAITLAGAKQKEIADLERIGKAIRVASVMTTTLPSGSAIVVSYGSNSARDRQSHEHHRYVPARPCSARSACRRCLSRRPRNMVRGRSRPSGRANYRAVRTNAWIRCSCADRVRLLRRFGTRWLVSLDASACQ